MDRNVQFALEAKKRQFIATFQDAGFFVRSSDTKGKKIVFRVEKIKNASEAAGAVQKG
jgi:hypothetical protein